MRGKMKIVLIVFLIAIALLIVLSNSNLLFSPMERMMKPAKCIDSDGGIISGVGGKTCSNLGSQQTSNCMKDRCATGDVLYEYYCSEGGSVDMERVICEFGCAEGICKNINRRVYLHRDGTDGLVDGKGIIIETSTIPRKDMVKRFDDSCLENLYGDLSNFLVYALNADRLEETCEINVLVQETFVIPEDSNSLFIESDESCMALNIKQGTFMEQTILTFQEVSISGCDLEILEFLDIFKKPDFQEYADDFEETKGEFFGLINSFAESCRDGILDDIEQCDIGWEDSDNHGAVCTEDCRFPVCGDGYMNQAEGVEKCDTHEFSNGEEYMLNPSCQELYGEQASNPNGAVYCTSCIIDNNECGL